MCHNADFRGFSPNGGLPSQASSVIVMYRMVLFSLKPDVLLLWTKWRYSITGHGLPIHPFLIKFASLKMSSPLGGRQTIKKYVARF